MQASLILKNAVKSERKKIARFRKLFMKGSKLKQKLVRQ